MRFAAGLLGDGLCFLAGLADPFRLGLDDLRNALLRGDLDRDGDLPLLFALSGEADGDRRPLGRCGDLDLLSGFRLLG